MRFVILTAAGLLGLSTFATAAEPPRLRELRTQTVNGVTYFEARFDRPADMAVPKGDIGTDRDPMGLARLPRLVPQDDKARDVG